VTLRLVAPDRLEWDRRAEESEDQYLAFLEWLHQNPRDRPASPALAAQCDWAARALAYDQMLIAPKAPKDQLVALGRDALQLATLEVAKFVRMSLRSEAPVLTVTELVRVAAWLSDAKSTLGHLENDMDLDLAKLSENDLELLLRAKSIFHTAKART